jgi:hypothetical protein
LRFADVVWRHIPRGSHPLDFSALINAAGRWNRYGLYGCLYTALRPTTVAAEYRKHFVRRGLRRARDLVSFQVDISNVLDVPAISMASGSPVAPPVIFGGPAPASTRRRLLPPIDFARLTGDTDADLEHCRQIADWARRQGYLAILAQSAALASELVLAIYPENRPGDLRIDADSGPFPLNYGDDPFLDDDGFPRRELP